MNTTGRLVFGLVLITGLAATGAAVEMHARDAASTPTIQLDAIVVTPASAPQTIELAAVRVVPTEADWRYARAHGLSLPVAGVASASETIELAAVQVAPTSADWQYARAYGAGQPATAVTSAESADGFGNIGAELIMQAVNALGPGQFLNTSAALRAFDALAFDGNGR